MIILGVETSCDETSIGILEKRGRSHNILANIVASQLAHSRYGGVVPEIAARTHVQLVVPITQLALQVAKKSFEDLDLVAVTNGPGLMGALLVGLSYAKALAIGCRIPLVGVNHIEGHIFSILLDHPAIKYPFLSLIVSGGHTELIFVKSKLAYEILGSTLDDACGEAFDKVARMLGLPYPGGPYVENLAQSGDAEAVNLPIPRIKDFDFSFSGLKTAVLYYVKKHPHTPKKNICANFQKVVVDFLIQKAAKAVRQYRCQRLGIAGGVSANRYLRDRMQKELTAIGTEIFLPSLSLSTDNAAMIAACGYEKYKKFGPSPLNLPAFARFVGFD